MRCCNSCVKYQDCQKKKYNRREIIQSGKTDISEMCKEYKNKFVIRSEER